MRVFRSITAEEITNLYRGKSNLDLNITRGENTHEYQTGVEYIHFFRYYEAAEFYHQHSFSIHNPHIAYMVANIPNELLRKTIGYGFYNGIETELKELNWTTLPLPEYAIQKETFKPEYVVEVNKYIPYEYKRKDEEYKQYLKLVLRLLETYDYNHYTVGRVLNSMDLESLLDVIDDDRTESEILGDKMKEFSKIRDDLLRGWENNKNMI